MPPRSKKRERQQRRRADRARTPERDELARRLAHTCAVAYASIFRHAIDSLIEIGRENEREGFPVTEQQWESLISAGLVATPNVEQVESLSEEPCERADLTSELSASALAERFMDATVEAPGAYEALAALNQRLRQLFMNAERAGDPDRHRFNRAMERVFAALAWGFLMRITCGPSTRRRRTIIIGRPPRRGAPEKEATTFAGYALEALGEAGVPVEEALQLLTPIAAAYLEPTLDSRHTSVLFERVKRWRVAGRMADVPSLDAYLATRGAAGDEIGDRPKGDSVAIDDRVSSAPSFDPVSSSDAEERDS